MDAIFNIQQTAQWIASFGWLAVGISLLLNILLSVAGVLPSIFLSGANAVVFGIVPGFFISLTGEVLGAGAAFLLYRWGIRSIIAVNQETSIRWIRKIRALDRRGKWLTILAARLIPLMPSGLVNLAAALAGVPFTDFLLASFIGKMPSLVFETFVGHDFIYFQENKVRFIWVLSLTMLIYLAYRVLKRKKEAK